MAVQNINTYRYKNIFYLETMSYNKAGGFNTSTQVENFTIFWIKRGEGTYNIDFKNYAFKDNIIFFLTPGQVFSVTSESIMEAYKISFTSDFYCIQAHDKAVACNGVLFNNVNNQPFVEPCKKDVKKMSFIIESIVDEFEDNKVAQYDMLQAYLKQFMIIAVRIQKELAPVKDNVEAQLFKEFNVLVEQNFKQIHTVADYAKRLSMSPKSLTKNFQKVGAKSPSDVIKARILIEAKRKLIYTQLPVKEIAYELGYQDAAYFTRFFSKSEEVSPLQYRKNNQNV